MSNMVTIAEVAAKLGLEREGLDWAGEIDGSRFFLCDGSVGVVPRGAASWLWIRNGVTAVSRREVCKLADVDYERYEGREMETEQAESEAPSCPLCSVIGGTCQNPEGHALYQRGLEAGRAEGAAIRAELLAELRRTVAWCPDRLAVSAHAAIARAEATETGPNTLTAQQGFAALRAMGVSQDTLEQAKCEHDSGGITDATAARLGAEMKSGKGAE